MAANSPDAGFDLSDAELAELDEIFAPEPSSGTTSTTDPAPSSSDPSPAGTSDPSASGNSAAGAEDRDVATGEQPAPAAAPAKEPAAAPAALAPSVPGAKPFQFNAAGGVHTLQGASELPDGSVVIAKDSLIDFRRTLASGRELQQNFRRTQSEFARQLKAAQEARTTKDVEAEMVYAMFGNLKKMTPEERWDYFQKFDEEAPKLELEVQRKQIEQDRAALARQKAGPVATPEEQMEQVQSVLTTELNATFSRLAALPEAKAFSKDELIELYKKWATRTNRLTRQAEQDNPQAGIKKGDWLFDDDDVVNDFRFMLSVKQKAGGGSAAAARNAAMNGDQSAIPPVVPGGRIPAAQATTKKDKPFDREAFMRGDEDDE